MAPTIIATQKASANFRIDMLEILFACESVPVKRITGNLLRLCPLSLSLRPDQLIQNLRI
jgi:hypothetical protein